jgi:fibrillarin-like rRNA methylase
MDYGMYVYTAGMVDVIFADVAQPDQARIGLFHYIRIHPYGGS